ncbi:MAG: CYTH domain-containing protein [Kangiellaceae bacterium]
MAQELELKLAATLENINKIKSLDLPGITSQTQWKTKQLNNTYFDNNEFKLRELAIGMRLRHDKDKIIQCVKSSGKAIGGLHQRNEDEIELDEPILDINKIQEPYLQILIEEAFEEGGEFVPCFQTNFDRTASLLTFSDGTQIEIALDIGEIVAGEEKLDICEVELELVSGSADYVFAIGRYLIKELGLVLANSSKARRGYSLCEGFNPRQKVMSVTELSQGIEAEKAFEKICFNSLNHWQYYELFLDRDNAHGAVLEMYRALMSLQHIYLVFGGLIPRTATNDLKRSWEWLGEAMRPIVDAAKHKRYLMSYLKLKADWDLVESQQEKIQEESKEMIEEFKVLLKTQRYNLMMLNMSQWLYNKEWQEVMSENEKGNLTIPIIDFAKKQLDHMLKELKRDLGPKIEMSPEDYFKQVSHLRRALDTGLFFGSLFDSQKRLAYRDSWIKIINGIRDLLLNQYIAELQTEHHTAEEIEVWLQQLNSPILENLESNRKLAFKMKGYWL